MCDLSGYGVFIRQGWGMNWQRLIQVLFEVSDSVERKHLISNLEKNEELKSLSLQETPWTLTAKKRNRTEVGFSRFPK